MLTLKPETASLINEELQSVPERYQRPFNSMHEALGIIREEYIELEQQIFFGEKKCIQQIRERDKILDTHGGSMSSRIAAHDMGFDFWGYEIDKDYFDAQEKRFKNHIAQLTLSL